MTMTMCTTMGAGGPGAFGPRRVPNTVVAWYRSDAKTTLSPNLSPWGNLAGIAPSLAQFSGPTTAPALSTNASFNSRKTVNFDGVNDGMITGAIVLVQPCHIFIPCMWNVAFASADAAFDGGSNVSMLFYRSAAGTVTLNAGTGLSYASATPTVPHVYALVVNGASGAIWQDNVSVATGNVGASNGNGLTLGCAAAGAFVANISIPEIIIYNGILSAPNATKVARYLGKIYGIAVA